MKMRALRSLLFVPGSRPRMLEKARSVLADAVVLDLEDAVAPDRKQEARAGVREALQAGSYGPRLVIRVNALDSGLAEADLNDVLGVGVHAICLPKAETARDVERLASLVETLERERGLPTESVAFLLLVETALGVLNAYEMATASGRVSALCLGGEDLCQDLGAVRSREGLELAYARGRLVLAARAAGVEAIDTVYTDIKDQSGLLADARFARQLGYSGKLLIHPCQIATVHRAFAPSEEEIAYARRVVQAYAASVEEGQGAFVVDGKMIDGPIVARARSVLSHLEQNREGE